MACPATGSPSQRRGYAKLNDIAPVTVYKPIAEPILLRTLVVEPIFLLGGQYAILLQFAHPGLAQGSLEHSDFGSRILNRLKTTTRFLTAAVFGTDEEKAAIMGVIHRKHATVTGGGGDEGFEKYFADNPELHKWTAATLFMSLLVVHKAIFGDIGREKEEQLFYESAIYATSLRMPPEIWPATLDDFYIYWNNNIATLPITPWAKTLCHQLMYPKYIPLPLQLLSPLNRLLTFHWLPERIRNGYGFPETRARRWAYQVAIWGIKWSYRAIPGRWRKARHRVLVEDMRRSVRRIQRTGTWAGTGEGYAKKNR